MDIKFIIFDLDGVLLEAKEIHFNALNSALKEIDDKFIISWEEHLSKYDGLKTNQKLKLLTEDKGLPKLFYEKIWKHKQDLTIKYINQIKPSSDLIECLKKLNEDGYKIGCCTNSIRKTTYVALKNLDIIQYFDILLSNDDVRNSKPHPEIYWKAMSMFDFFPDETLIVEDSPHGLLAANHSKANLYRVKKPKDVTYSNIVKQIHKIKNMKKTNAPKWKDEKLNVLIPMAGAGSRFEQKGYTFPKPLIDVNGKPMIQNVIENLNIDANYIYVIQKSHELKYNLSSMLNLLTPKCKIVQVDGLTEGAACTTLLAKEYIDNDNPLLMANSDQYVEWNSNEFMYKMNETDCDAGILTFNSTHPKWSFVKLNDKNLVCEVAEKNPISDIATVGIYFWKNGSDYVKYAEKMIEKNNRFNNEFYVCPVFNEAILENKKIITYNIDKMWGLGTPEDLETFLKNF